MAGNVVVSGQIIPSWVVAPPRSYLAGFTLSNDSGSPTTVLDIAAGDCTDSANTTWISLTSAFTKSTAGVWAAGTGNNGMGTGLTIAISTWYHVFAIINNTEADVYFDTSVTATNAPTGTTSTRRIGSFKTDASAHILAFTQNGDEFLWILPVEDLTLTVGTGGANHVLASVPTGVRVNALGSAYIANAAAVDVLIVSPDLGTPTASGTIWTMSLGLAADDLSNSLSVRTDTSAQIYARADVATTTFDWVTFGWIDTRGKNS